MDLPALVAEHLDDEPVRERVEMGDDQVVVTPTRTLVYRSEGLISDEAVSAFPNEVDRLDVSTGRKATFEFSYIDDTRSFRVDGSHAEAVLRAVLSGVLAAEGVVGPDESVRESYRFDELTFVLTGERALKHVGDAVWDAEFESFPFADLTRLAVEEGVHATQLVLEVDGRPQRVKVPADEARLVHRAIEEAVFAHYGVDSAAELEAEIGGTDEERTDEEPAAFEGGEFEPLVAAEDAADATHADATDAAEDATDTIADADSGERIPPGSGLDIDLAPGSEDSTAAGGPDRATGGEPAAGDASTGHDGPDAGTDGPTDLAREVAALREAVEGQNEQLRAQAEAIERLVAELREDSQS